MRAGVCFPLSKWLSSRRLALGREKNKKEKGKKKKTPHRWIETISQGVLLRSTAASVDSSQALCVDPSSTLCSELSWMYCAAPLVVEYLKR